MGIFDVKVEEILWHGEPAISLAAGGYKALVLPEIGANLISLSDETRQLELLRCPKDANELKQNPVIYGVPVLFPPNRIGNGVFETEEKVYHFPVNETDLNNHLHGFLHNVPWQVMDADVYGDQARVELAFSCNEKTVMFEYFPHKFEIRLQYTLSLKGLEQIIKIHNQGSEKMPLGLGFHTCFNIPFHPMGKADSYRLKVSVDKKVEYDKRYLPTGQLLGLNDFEKLYPEVGVIPQGELISEYFTSRDMIVDGENFHGAIIEDLERKIRLVYKVDHHYKHWVLWNGSATEGFVCPEPQTWMVNAPNTKLPNDVTGFQLLEPYRVWEAATFIYVKEI